MKIKEKRAHIKPFLRFAIKELEKKNDGLCHYIQDYCQKVFRKGGANKIRLQYYLENRLEAARPLDSGKLAYWWHGDDNQRQKRIDFCKLQLKIVKP